MIEATKTKRDLDKVQLRNMFLDDILAELRRRGAQIIYGNSFAMLGRVIFLPASHLSIQGTQGWANERAETPERDVSKSGGIVTGVGLPPERQDQRAVDRPQAGSDVGAVASRPDTSASQEEPAA